MLHHFLEDHRGEILARARAKLAERENGANVDADAMALFFQQLVEQLRAHAGERESNPHAVSSTAVERGASLQKLGVSVGDVVHSYGVICDSVTSLAGEAHLAIRTDEFHALTTVLDEAMSAAVSEHTRLADRRTAERLHEEARIHLGALAHEMRNALSTALFALSILKQGRVAIGSSTGGVLERSLIRLASLVDRSLAEVRLEAEPELRVETFALAALLNEVEAAASFEASARDVQIEFDVDPRVEVTADSQLLLSALTNLALNGVKYSRRGGGVRIVARGAIDAIAIDVVDSCGGLPPGKAEELFAPFVRKAKDQAGLGLGLTIAWRAVRAHGGDISVTNDPPQGCVFTIELPRAVTRAT